jgi:predicted DNA-binding transcriptional regulator AlpA
MSKAKSPAVPEGDSLVPRAHALRTILRVSTSTAWRLEKNNPLWPRPYRVGARNVFYRRSDIDNFLGSLSQTPSPMTAAVTKSVEVRAAKRKAVKAAAEVVTA